MGLPKIVTPQYSVKLFSIKDPVSFRPYLVKEEKLFMTAKQSEDPQMMVDAILQVVKDCTFGKIAVDDLPSFDLEYLFLQLRAKSVNNVIKLTYNCQNMVKTSDDTTATRCGQVNTVTVNLDEVAISTDASHVSTVTLNNGMVIELRHPTIRVVRTYAASSAPSQVESNTIKIIAECLKTITDDTGTTYEARDYTLDERIEFIESMGIGDVQQFESFFNTMPALKHTVPFVCSKCAYTEPIVLEGLTAFF